MECANCAASWNELVSADKSSFIRTKEELENYDFSNLFSTISNDDLTEFKKTVEFRREEVFNESEEKVAIKQGVSTFSVEVFIKKYNFTPDEIEKVAAIFGIGPNKFWSKYHYFGDLHPYACCRPRAYYTCPWDVICP